VNDSDLRLPINLVRGVGFGHRFTSTYKANPIGPLNHVDHPACIDYERGEELAEVSFR
jgi:hypothetical protein